MTFTTIASISVVVLASAAAISQAMPRHVTIERSSVVSAAPDEVLALAASTEGYQQFNPYKTLDPNLKITGFGPSAGIGAGFAFDGKDGKGTLTVAEISDSHVLYAIDMGPLGQPTQSITATPTAEGTVVTWRMESDMGFNPVFRVMGLFMERMMGPTFELGLENIAEATA